jgi:MFS family permease
MSSPEKERGQRRNVALLALCQGMLLTNGVTQVAVTGLVGLKLAPDLRLATLPATTYVLGAAAATLPAAFLMKRYGRRFGFMLGACFGILGGFVSATAVWTQSFLLLCLGTICAGIYNAIGQQYRFAAADAVDVRWKSKAISLTLAGGILGGIVGPALSTDRKSVV